MSRRIPLAVAEAGNMAARLLLMAVGLAAVAAALVIVWAPGGAIPALLLGCAGGRVIGGAIA